MSEQTTTQSHFFNYLTAIAGRDIVFNKTMEVLSLGKGAVYKRINGTTALTAAELVLLSKAFKVSLDDVFQSSRYMSFTHPFWKEEKTNSTNFMDRFAYYFKPIKGHEHSHITYLANELPVTYYFSHKNIFSFLLSIWNHLHWDDSRLTIDENMAIDAKMEKLRQEVTIYYAGSPVTEIWNSNMLSNLYQQIYFCITIRAFESSSFINRLIRDIHSLINELRQTALTGTRVGYEDSAGLKIYLNEFGNYANILLYESSQVKGAFIGIDMPQFMISYNPHFYKHAEQWINNIKKRSVLISSEGFQYRELFFHKLDNDYKAFKDRAEKLMGVYYE